MYCRPVMVAKKWKRMQKSIWVGNRDGTPEQLREGRKEAHWD